MSQGVHAAWEARVGQLLSQLWEVADELEDLGRFSYLAGLGDTEMPLREVSQSLYRALVALAPLCSWDTKPKGGPNE
jgi:hypothetical protein